MQVEKKNKIYLIISLNPDMSRNKKFAVAGKNTISKAPEGQTKPPSKSAAKTTRAPQAKITAKPTAQSKTPTAQPSSGNVPMPPRAPPSFLKKAQPSDSLDDPTSSSDSSLAKNAVIRKPLQRRTFPKGNIVGLHFKIATTEEIIGVDRCKVTEPVISTATNAVCDLRMGATVDVNCASCSLPASKCGGHPGYIELAWPIINPVFIKSVLKIMRLFCFRHFKNYRRLQVVEIASIIKKSIFKEDGTQYTMQELERLAEERIAAKPNAPAKIMPCFDPEQPERDYPDAYGSWRLQLIEAHRGCKKCVADKEEVHYNIRRDFYIEEKINEAENEIDPQDILKFFTAIDEDPKGWARILGFGENKLASMINVVWPVMSNPQRLDISTPEKMLVDPLSKLYADIVKHNKMLKEMINHHLVTNRVVEDDESSDVRSTRTDALTFIDMQRLKYYGDTEAKSPSGAEVYNSLNASIKSLIYDKEDTEKEQGQRRSSQVMSITIIVNGKPGILRKHVMGKGSDHGGRTVIIGDNNIDIDEIGITRAFTDVLTIPEVLRDEADVARWSAEMPKLVGEMKVMGSIIKVMRAGRTDSIKVTVDSTIQLRVGDTVRRKMMNGDVVVVSRQPVLHKGGVLGFRIRIFEEGGNVLRLHPAVAGSFNADFDGDEMNFSVPQDLESRADVLEHMMVGNCIRGDKYSAPWTGMIQNPVIAARQITQSGVIIERNLAKRLIDIGLETFRRRNPGGIFRTDTKEYYDQLYSLDIGIDPSSGHALVSFFMPKDFKYQRRRGKGEDPVVVEKGFLLTGVMDKADIGKASNGMVDNILSTYGSEAVIVFVSALNRALYEFLSSDGFSIGIRDCILPNLSDGTNPQDNIDNLIADTSKQVVELLKKGQEASYLGRQAEAQADKLLAALSDRINAIVVAGGIDVSALQGTLRGEKNDTTLKEILSFLMTIPVTFDEEEPSTSNLMEAGILEASEESLHKLTAKMLRVMEKGRHDGDKNGQYNEEMHVLRIWSSMVAKMEPIDHHFEDIALAMLAPEDVNGTIVEKLLAAAHIRSELIGASKYDNRLLTTVYSGAKGSKSNVLQALGLVGPQEKSFIDRDKTLQRSLPFHKEGELDPTANYFCGSSYAKGLDVFEFWNHAAASRANIITSNLKPPVTGWFYRRAICLMIDIHALMDGSVRDEKSRIVQFMYGGDGCDPTRLIHVDKSLPPQFINMSAAAKNLRTNEDLPEFELK